jgi:hypothetical protein
MSKAVVIRLDPSKPSSEVRGERCVDDPHYRVAAFQGYKVGKKTVLLPFDATGELVPDDGKTTPWDGVNVESKPVKHYPLYNDNMRALVERLTKRAKERLLDPDAAVDEEEAEETAAGEANDPADDVNLVSWLKGEERYMPTLIRAAVKKRYHVQHREIPPLVVHLVDDEKLIPREQVCKELAKFLPA